MQNHFQHVANFINEMKSTSSTNAKKEILKKYDTPFLRNLFNYVYTPFKQYYVSSDNLRKNSHLSTPGYTNLFVLLDDLSSRRITGHDAVSAVNGFINLYPEFADVIYQVFDRNLKTRATTTIINDIMPGTIPVFEVALAEKYKGNEKRVNFFEGLWWASRKLDGCLHADSIIEFEDGRTIKIKEVVNKKISGKVKSLNIRTNKIEYKNILNWMKNIKDIHEDSAIWYKIILENEKTLILTGNHRVWLPILKCWRRVDELDGSETLLTD